MPTTTLIVQTLTGSSSNWSQYADTANSYISLTDAKTYFAGSIQCAEWTAALDATKELALISAVRINDRLAYKYTRLNWNNVMQALAFPRVGYPADDRHLMQTVAGLFIIPQDIKAAQCEQAQYLLRIGTNATKFGDLSRMGVGSQNAGDIGVTIDRTPKVGASTLMEMGICDEAMRYLYPWISRERRIGRG